MRSEVIFEFESSDSIAQFAIWMLPIAGGAFIGILLWTVGKIAAVATALAVVLLLVAGLRASISVSLGHVRIVRKWFCIPYRVYSGSEIEDVWLGGDYGLEDGAMGVVVKLSGRELHIGTRKNMRKLYAALSPLTLKHRERMANQAMQATRETRAPDG